MKKKKYIQQLVTLTERRNEAHEWEAGAFSRVLHLNVCLFITSPKQLIA